MKKPIVIYSQSDLARDHGVSKQAINSRKDRGKLPPFDYTSADGAHGFWGEKTVRKIPKAWIRVYSK